MIKFAEIELRKIGVDKTGVLQSEIPFGSFGIMHQLMPLLNPEIMRIRVMMRRRQAEFPDTAADIQDLSPTNS